MLLLRMTIRKKNDLLVLRNLLGFLFPTNGDVNRRFQIHVKQIEVDFIRSFVCMRSADFNCFKAYSTKWHNLRSKAISLQGEDF